MKPLSTLHECGLCAAAFLLCLLLRAFAWDTRDLDGDEYECIEHAEAL